MMMDAFGKHTIIDFKEGDATALDNPDLIKSFVYELVDTLDMTAYGDCWCEKFGDDPKVAGYSFYQMIQESNISGHLVSYDYIMKNGKNNKGAGYIDIFSCKDYEPEDAIELVKKYFHPKEISKMVLIRE